VFLFSPFVRVDDLEPFDICKVLSVVGDERVAVCKSRGDNDGIWRFYFFALAYSHTLGDHIGADVQHHAIGNKTFYIFRGGLISIPAQQFPSFKSIEAYDSLRIKE